MKLLVFGAGAIGCAFGGFLARAGHDVVLYGRERHLQQMRRNGLRMSGIWGRHRVRSFEYATQPRHLAKHRDSFDLVLLTVKSFDTRSACQLLKKVVSRQTPILSLQNGLGNIETLHRFFPGSRVLAARVIFGVERELGAVRITVWGGDVLVGETAKKRVSTRARKIARVFTRAGIGARAVNDVRAHIWGKVVYNCALNPLASLLGVHYGALVEDPHTKYQIEEIVRECYVVARREGIRMIPAKPDAYLKLLFGKLIPNTYDHHPSMLFDLKRRRKTEIGSLNGAICRLGRRHKIPTPVNQWITDLMTSVSATS